METNTQVIDGHYRKLPRQAVTFKVVTFVRPEILIYHDLREENRLLLIEVFRRLINPQNDGHLDQLWGVIFFRG